jgi:hypothetical protein
MVGWGGMGWQKGVWGANQSARGRHGRANVGAAGGGKKAGRSAGAAAARRAAAAGLLGCLSPATAPAATVTSCRLQWGNAGWGGESHYAANAGEARGSGEASDWGRQRQGKPEGTCQGQEKG